MTAGIHEYKASQTNCAALEVRIMIPSLFGLELLLSASMTQEGLSC